MPSGGCTVRMDIRELSRRAARGTLRLPDICACCAMRNVVSEVPAGYTIAGWIVRRIVGVDPKSTFTFPLPYCSSCLQHLQGEPRSTRASLGPGCARARVAGLHGVMPGRVLLFNRAFVAALIDLEPEVFRI